MVLILEPPTLPLNRPSIRSGLLHVIGPVVVSWRRRSPGIQVDSSALSLLPLNQRLRLTALAPTPLLGPTPSPSPSPTHLQLDQLLNEVILFVSLPEGGWRRQSLSPGIARSLETAIRNRGPVHQGNGSWLSAAIEESLCIGLCVWRCLPPNEDVRRSGRW